ncbi:hypothetical protein NIES37_62700 [Tolypothrix tenuis PCC 7101]|uniref:KGK family protein n=1 Tax=Tolypothrix tenuis PCC 7101 TaxID=231146 RepID=A0A1Z4N955_9CYAN|nr:hypothetical protein [Aulosira sp. FACHB-113]BAZ02258.1 hypothetical protein NIES37_62700 [Tolypothrix tenuis PCC 7101]BAZ73821.1 hypothetical protein NIES50_23870 [Aulosira laxa NIES-50]
MNKVNLTDDDVVSMSEDASFTKSSTSTARELMSALEELLCNSDLNITVVSSWADGIGVDCKVIQAKGGGWKTGKVRLQIEFIPDQPATPVNRDFSPLDDLRNNL